MEIILNDLLIHQYPKFRCDTRIIIQVRGSGTIIIGREQGEVQNPGDGLQFTQASTSTPQQPYDTVWNGEFWYRTDTVSTQLILLVIGKVGEEARGTAARGI